MFQFKVNGHCIVCNLGHHYNEYLGSNLYGRKYSITKYFSNAADAILSLVGIPLDVQSV